MRRKTGPFPVILSEILLKVSTRYFVKSALLS